MPFDYSEILTGDEDEGTWRDIYDDDLTLPENLLSILQKTVFLPHDFYDIIAAYYLLPSALCKVIPYLFFYGQSGSGKSTVAKLASLLHGIPINSSADTFASIRNSLNKRKKTTLEIPAPEDSHFQCEYKKVERNTCMVWDDIKVNTFTSNSDLYNMFRCGYDRSTERMTISGDERGTNLVFKCFCPKIFSSITPLHLDDRLRELKRRLIVIPCKRVEDLSSERQVELGIVSGNWQHKLVDLDDYDWTGLANEFDALWDLDLAKCFYDIRKVLAKSAKGLTSQQRKISLDLLACGLVTNIWSDEQEAVDKLRFYWDWHQKETEGNASLGQYLKEFVRQESQNAINGGTSLGIYTSQLRYQINIWYEKGWIMEKPKPNQIKELMLDLGLRLHRGKWVKG